MSKSQIAVDNFKAGFNCAQSVLSSYAEELKIDKETAFKISNGFGAGMARKQEICGAISGAIMVLGLKYGRGEQEGKAKQEKLYEKVQDLLDRFEYEFGTINCKQLLSGCNLQTEEGQRQFKEQRLNERCRDYVEDSSNFVETLMKD
jgi:C_GCAxxG_C_C family probable redox protein